MRLFSAFLNLKLLVFTGSFIVLFSLSLIAQTQQATSSDSLVSKYNLAIKISPESNRIEVKGTMLLPPSLAVRDSVKFLLWSRIENLSVQILEPKTVSPLLELSNDKADGDRTWTVKPSKPFPANQPILLQFSYVSDGKSYPQFTISPESSYAGGGGELWYPQMSFKAREIGILKFTVPAGEAVISNGVGVSTAAQKAEGEFVFRVTKPVKFGFAAGNYKTFRHAGKIPITLYLLKSRDTAQNIINLSAKALNFLTDLNGKFPYPEFSLVEVDFRGRLGGTGEFGFILADKKELDLYNLSYWAHEIGHQWWGDLIRSKLGEFGQMMFSEGMTQFGSLLAVETIEGEKAAEEFRRNSYRDFRKIHSAKGYFQLISSGTDFPLTLYKPKDQNETLLMHRLANSKGFILMDMLSRQIGRAKLAAILKRFISRHAEQLTSWQELQKTIEAEAGQDIHWFFEQWFERTGAPDYQLTWKQEGKTIRGEITQPAPFYRSTLEVEIKGASRRLFKNVEVINGQTEFKWTIPFKVDSVTLDPHYKVLRWTPEFRGQ